MKKVPDTAWYDSSGGTAQAMINQTEYSFEDEDNTVIAADNPDVKAVFDTVTGNAADGLSTGLTQWSEDWTASFQNDGFATMACPGWMLGVIEGNADGVEGWDIANVFPGGGGNWGGSYLTVPAQGDHPEEAKALAAWLTAPEQQIKAFEAKGTFPSQVDALDDPALTGATNAFFNDAPTGRDPGRARRGSAVHRRTRGRSSPTSTRRSSRRSSGSTRARSRPTRPGTPSSPTSSGWADPSRWRRVPLP